MNPSSYSVPEISSLGIHPYLDFITLTKKVEDFDRSFLKRKSDYKFQFDRGYTPIDIYHSNYYKTLTVKGSMPWFLNGHNLTFSNSELQEVIDGLCITLDVDLHTAVLKSFELSKICSVEYPVIDYQNNHFRLKGFERVQHQKTLYYNLYNRRGNRKLTLKMYDAKDNARAKNMTLQPDYNLLKVEGKIWNVSSHFNQSILVTDLIEDKQILNKVYTEMKHYYSKIEKGLNIELPHNPNADDIIIASLISSTPNPMEEIEKYIKSSSLNPQQKWRRKMTIKEKIKRVAVKDSKYDLELD